MRISMFLLSCCAFFGGGAVLIQAKSAVHEIEAFVLFLIAATLLGAAAVVEAVTRGAKRLEKTEAALADIATQLAARATPASRIAATPPPTSEPGYWVRMGNDTSGPFPVAKIRELRNRGAIDADTPIALEGETEWKASRDVLGA